MTSPLVLNAGAQTEFVHNAHRYSAFIGGLGSGKTYAGLARALKYAMQPRPSGVYHGPRGLVAAISYPVLTDVVLPLAEELVHQTGVADWDKDYARGERKLKLKNGGEIIFRSLDEPNRIRGVELSWAFIDEGRHLTMEHWKVVIGRLRQAGYEHAAWVASTPSGHDWMWRTFHPSSPDVWKDAVWYGAPTYDNAKHLPDEYVSSLEAAYEGRFFEQEVLGRFVGVIQGSVFPHWDPHEHTKEDLKWRPDLPLYTFWDFGYGDLGVCVFAQIEWREKATPSGRVKVPWLYIVDAIAAKEWTSETWANAYKAKLQDAFDGQKTAGNYGDPAGKQRQGVTGSSYIEDLSARGVSVEPVSKRPQDYAIRILNNMMAGGRVLVAEGCASVAEAIAEHHWKTDGNGMRIGENPVHDWTSHYVDAIRYGATALLSNFARPYDEADPHPDYRPDQMGYLFDQLVSKSSGKWLGQPDRVKRPTFQAPAAQPRS